jgi:protein TonB
MASSELSNLAPLSAPPSSPSPGGPPAGGWLGSQSIFDEKDDRKIGRAMLVSLIVHGTILVLLIVGGIQHVVAVQKEPPLTYNVTFLKEPGPGGGGGGSPAPAPPKRLEIPHPKPPEPVPVPQPTPPPPPLPTLNAPVQTNLDVLQAQGASAVSMSRLGGGGSGGGMGPGRGRGLGEGSEAGTGGGAYQPGNGVSTPEIVRKVDPAYTSDAMRAKVQGEVVLEGIVQPNGLLSDIKVLKSLDRMYGLDQAAKDAATKWLFTPGKKDGKAVPVVVTLVMEFRLH